MTLLAGYAVATLIFLVIDLLWLGVLAKSFYRRTLGPLLRDPIDLKAAGLFYLVYPAGLVTFAIAPAAGNVSAALLSGGLFGAFCYATYDLTNQATLKGWSWRLSVVDVAWGAALSAVTAAATVALLGR
jgi:uncharacterized membrane protein